MEKIKQYKYIILIVVVVLGFTFYWYEWRPIQIKKECYIEVMEVRDKQKNYSFGFMRDKFDVYYKNCLRERGL